MKRKKEEEEEAERQRLKRIEELKALEEAKIKAAAAAAAAAAADKTSAAPIGGPNAPAASGSLLTNQLQQPAGLGLPPPAHQSGLVPPATHGSSSEIQVGFELYLMSDEIFLNFTSDLAGHRGEIKHARHVSSAPPTADDSAPAQPAAEAGRVRVPPFAICNIHEDVEQR